jgi:hypothetical protein
MKTLTRTALAALAITLLGAGSVAAAEACACCKEGQKMACCDKMQDKPTAPKPGEAPAPAPEHKH